MVSERGHGRGHLPPGSDAARDQRVRPSREGLQAERWFIEEYEPHGGAAARTALLEGFATETDAYFHLTCERYKLMQSQEWSEEALERVRRRG